MQLFSGFTLDNAILLEMTNRDSASVWSFEDNFLIHAGSGQVLSAHSDGSMYLAPRTPGLSRSLSADLGNIVVDRSLGVVSKLLTLFDYLKVFLIEK